MVWSGYIYQLRSSKVGFALLWHSIAKERRSWSKQMPAQNRGSDLMLCCSSLQPEQSQVKTGE